MSDKWQETTLGEVCRITIGRTPPRKESRYWTDDLSRPFCSIADMTGREIDPSREGVSKAAEQEGKAKRVPAGALLMSFKLTIGRVGFAVRDLFPNEAIAWLQATSEQLEERYLALWLEGQDLTEGSGRAVKGATLNSVSLRAIAVSIPPLAVQRRIVDLVGAIDAHIANTDAEYVLLRMMLRTLAGEAWESAATPMPIESLGRVVTGSTPKTSVADFWSPPQVPFLTPGDLADFGVVRHAARSVSRLGADAGRHIPSGSLCVVCIGATIGKTGLTEMDLVTNQQINSVTGLDARDAAFLGLLLFAPPGQAALAEKSAQTAVPILNKKQFGSVQVPWPSEHVRGRMASIARTTVAQTEALMLEVLSLQTLRSQVLNALLTREVEVPEGYDVLLDAGVS